MRVFVLGLSFLTLLASCSKNNSGGGTTITPAPPAPKDWKFETTPIWDEEFDYTGKPYATNWTYDLGGTGWGNNELEYYTDDSSNAYIKDGVLTITARREDKGNMHYTSARLVSKNAGDFLYGKVEVKAKLPAGKGTWPAIWMLPTDWAYGDWPKSGEFDIMEHVGYDPGNIHVSAHTEKYNFKQNNQKTATLMVPDATSAFHIYSVEWTPDAVKGYVDNQLVLTYANEGIGYASWPFDKRFHLLLNLAVGGDWGGIQGVDDTIFPVSMDVDYVKVYKLIQ
jgi:beta-glucanase (GH16 family)